MPGFAAGAPKCNRDFGVTRRVGGDNQSKRIR
jgi:hypothetical protein